MQSLSHRPGLGGTPQHSYTRLAVGLHCRCPPAHLAHVGKCFALGAAAGQADGNGKTGEVLDVAVIGGGPGGLAAAAALLRVRPDLSVSVFERSTLRPRGSYLILHARNDGLGALHAISPELADKIYSLRADIKTFRLCDMKGNILKEGMSPGLGPVLAAAAPVLWHELQRSLADVLPPGVLHTERSFSHFTPHDEWVEVFFNGSQPPVRARLLVGADGNRSIVRQQCLGDGPPEYGGQVIWRGICPTPDWWEIKDGATHFVEGNTFMRVSAVRGSLVWTAVASWPEDQLDRLTSTSYVQDPDQRAELAVARKQRVLDAFEGCSDQITRLVEATDAATIVEHGTFYRLPEHILRWGEGRVTLLGDAAHLATPALGPGANEALKDAVELARSVGQAGLTPQALRAYEQLRQRQVAPRHAASVAMALDFAKSTSGSNSSQNEAQVLIELLEKMDPIPPLEPAATLVP